MNTLLVTSAAGQLGCRVLSHLLDTLQIEPSRLIASTRHPESLQDLAARGVTVRKADFDDAASLPAVFDGVQRALIISTDPIDRPSRRQEQHQHAIAAAERAGVQHLVYTSCPLPDNSPLLIAADHAGTEQSLRDSSVPGWTVLRNHWYFENLFHKLPGVWAQGGNRLSAAGDGRIACLSGDDLARTAAIAVASMEGGRRTLTLRGDEALSATEQAQVLALILGRPIEVMPVPVEALVQDMAAASRVAEVTPDCHRLTRSAPQRFAERVPAHRDTLGGR